MPVTTSTHYHHCHRRVCIPPYADRFLNFDNAHIDQFVRDELSEYNKGVREVIIELSRLDVHDDVDLEAILLFLEDQCPHLEKVVLSGGGDENELLYNQNHHQQQLRQKQQHLFLQAIVGNHHHHHVTEIRLYNLKLPARDLEMLVRSCRSLTQLLLHNCTIIVHDKQNNHHHHPNENNHNENHENENDNLQLLGKQNCCRNHDNDDDDDDEFQSLKCALEECTHLQKLLLSEINNDPWLLETMLLATAGHLLELELSHLTIGSSSTSTSTSTSTTASVVADSLQSMLESSTTLQHLALKHIMGIDATSFAKIMTGIQSTNAPLERFYMIHVEYENNNNDNDHHHPQQDQQQQFDYYSNIMNDQITPIHNNDNEDDAITTTRNDTEILNNNNLNENEHSNKNDDNNIDVDDTADTDITNSIASKTDSRPTTNDSVAIETANDDNDKNNNNYDDEYDNNDDDSQVSVVLQWEEQQQQRQQVNAFFQTQLELLLSTNFTLVQINTHKCNFWNTPSDQTKLQWYCLRNQQLSRILKLHTTTTTTTTTTTNTTTTNTTTTTKNNNNNNTTCSDKKDDNDMISESLWPTVFHLLLSSSSSSRTTQSDKASSLSSSTVGYSYTFRGLLLMMEG